MATVISNCATGNQGPACGPAPTIPTARLAGPCGLMQWNCNGLRSKQEELKRHIAENDHYDIICVQETFLTAKQDISFPGFTVIREDRKGMRKGGLITLVRETLNYTPITGPSGIECIVLQIKTKTSHLTVANVYISPDKKFDKNDLKPLFKPKTVIVGDLNSKSKIWGSNHSDARGRIIEELMEENDFCCINDGQPTYTFRDGTRTHLDVCLVPNSIAARCSWLVLNNTLGSDHNPTVTRLFDEFYTDKQPGARFRLSRADWPVFKEKCRETLTAEVASLDVNVYNEQLTAAIITAAEACIPQRRPGRRRIKPLPYWTDGCTRAVKDRNRARNAMCRKKTPESCETYRRLKGAAQHEIKSSARQHWQEYCSTLDTTSKLGSVWSMARKMNGTVVDRKISNLLDNGKLVETAKDKAELLAQSFSNISSNENYSDNFKAHRAEVEANEQHSFQNIAAHGDDMQSVNQPFSMAELRRAIRESKRNKASGEDRVSYEMLQKLPKSSVKVVLGLYNKLWTTGEFPEAWRHSVVLPVLKPGKDSKSTASYRPISLTSTLCKIMERLVTTRLAYHLEENNLLTGVQCGFRKGRSTTDHIMRLQDVINKHNNNKGYTLGVFIDFSSAFDMVWQNGLLIKMKKLGLTGNVFSFVQNFMAGRTIQVQVGGETSTPRQVENGTAQGSVISPLLFLIMINDLPECLSGVESTLFADDSCIFKSGKDLESIVASIQVNLHNIATWCDQWGFKINTEKTVAVLFTHRIDKIESKLVINGKEIKVEKTAKFLGVIFDSRLTWNAHIAYIEDKCRKRLNLLRMVSGQTWGASKKSLLTIYKALIRSVLDYGSIAYNTTSAANKLRLDRIQSAALRIACGACCSTAVAALQVETGEMPLELRRQQQELNYAIKLRNFNEHPTQRILQRERLAITHRYNENNKPFYCRVKEFFDGHEAAVQPQAPRRADRPPWQHKSVDVDKSLTLEVSKKDSPVILKALALELIDSYNGSVKIYTDASKTVKGKTAAAYYIPDYGIGQASRLSDNLTIFTAELTAIKLALQWVSVALCNVSQQVAIFSDSLSSLQAIETGKSACRPDILADVLELITRVKNRTVFVWVPSHIGISGNEAVDKLANTGVSAARVDLAIPLGVGEAKSIAESHVLNKWQLQWSDGETGRQYHAIEPKVTGGIKYVSKNRRKEVRITRLRLGKCRLNAYLHEMRMHSTGLCDQCKKPETVEHHLLQCKNTVSSALQQACITAKIVPTLANVLSNPNLMEVISNKLDRQI